MSIEVLDSAGHLVRKVSSSDPPEYSTEQMAREIIPQYWIKKTVPPSVSAGMHRWVWDLHYAPPKTMRRGFPISAVPNETPSEPSGPAAVPGMYQVVLKVGSHEWRAPLAVTPDPRVTAPSSAYLEQFTAARRLADVLNESTEALAQAQSIRKQIKDLLENPGTLGDQLHALDDHIGAMFKGTEGQPPSPGLEKLNGETAGLYAQVNAADAAPTAVQASETDRMVSDWQAMTPKWHEVQTQIQSLNAALSKAKRPRLEPEKAVPRDLDFADED